MVKIKVIILSLFINLFKKGKILNYLLVFFLIMLQKVFKDCQKLNSINVVSLLFFNYVLIFDLVYFIKMMVLLLDFGINGLVIVF